MESYNAYAYDNNVCLTIYKQEDQERWQIVPETLGLYAVSTLGNMVSYHRHGRGKRGKALKTSRNAAGYHVVTICV